MKRIYSCISLLLLFVCGKDSPKEWNEINHINKTRVIIQDTIDKSHYEDLLFSLFSLQEKVYTEHKHYKQLLDCAFDSSKEFFYSVGTSVINESLPKEAQIANRKMKAKFKGEQWALRLKTMYNKTEVNFQKTPSGKVLYSKPVLEIAKAETLYILLKVPVGSICPAE